MLLESHQSTNSNIEPDAHVMPDIANEAKPAIKGKLNRVGMKNVELPINLDRQNKTITVPAKADLFVNLEDENAKGIHMSRLYQIATNELEETTLNLETLKKILDKFLTSHNDISNEAFISLEFEYMLKRPSLLSKLEGWRSYPVKITARKTPTQTNFELETQVVYSSTCPCSASLARQLIQNRFLESFEGTAFIEKETIFEWLGKEDSICATPHSQRSHAIIKVKLDPEQKLDPIQLIDSAEDSLCTSVQAMVKREDEQEFAKLNGKNLMFCEDAARKIQARLLQEKYIDFKCEVRHLESLHPHDAVAITTKGVEGGFTP